MNKERIFVVDGNGYLWRAFSTLNSHRPIAIAFPFHLASMICKDAIAVKAKHLLVAFDGPDNFRYGVYDKYKLARREKQGIEGGGPASSTTGIYSYLGAIKNYFLHAGIPYYMPEHHEADDVLCSVANRYYLDYDIVCGTSDKDARQILREGVRLYDSRHKNADKKPDPIYITHEDVYEGIGCDRILDYQTLIGDRVDSIPSIMGPKKAQAVLAAHRSLNAWASAAEGKEKDFIHMKAEEIRRNRALVKLSTDALPDETPEQWKIPKTAPDMDLPQSYYNYNAFCYRARGLFA
jgi:5'-3' exonuclease